MIIRKKFRFEGAHIVRNCTSHRCRENIHGHSYVVEVFLKPDLTSNPFLMDKVLLRNISEFIHSFDHSFTLWDKEPDEVKDGIYSINTRVAEIPVSPSAEGYALLLLFVIDQMISTARLGNGVGEIKLQAVGVHETQSGYAESNIDDLNLVWFTMEDVKFNEGIKKEWKNAEWWPRVLNVNNL